MVSKQSVSGSTEPKRPKNQSWMDEFSSLQVGGAYTLKQTTNSVRVEVVELTHLLEPTHGPRFVQLMDHFLPHWQQRRELLNALPVRHHEWGY